MTFQRKKSSDLEVPREAIEQEHFFQWANAQRGKWPELEDMYAIPNGGSRHHLEAANLKKQGVKSGIPDICLPLKLHGYGALYIELKRKTGGRLTDAQKERIPRLRKNGNAVVICKGSEEAEKATIAYLQGDSLERWVEF